MNKNKQAINKQVTNVQQQTNKHTITTTTNKQKNTKQNKQTNNQTIENKQSEQ